VIPVGCFAFRSFAVIALCRVNLPIYVTSYFVALHSKFAKVRVLEIGFAVFNVEGLELIV